MKKTLLILLLILTIVQAITVSPPPEKEIIYEPGKLVSLEYGVANPEPVPTKFEVEISSPFKIEEPKRVITAASSSTKKFKVEFELPYELKPGIYPISVRISELSGEGGMGAITGVVDTVRIISPYEKGFPYGTLNFRPYFQPGQPVTFILNTQNIGKTILAGAKADASLKQNGIQVKRTTTDLLAIEPFLKLQNSGSIETTGLQPGTYDLEVAIGEQKLEGKVLIGKPNIQLENIPRLQADAENNITAMITLNNWSTPIEEAYVTFHVNMLTHEVIQTTLYPGINEVPVNTRTKPGKTGTYKGTLRISGNLILTESKFTADVAGSATQKGTIGFKKTNETTEEDEYIEEQLAPPETQAPAKTSSKSEIFLIALLIASFAIFAFALGQYIAKRKQNETPPAP